METKKTLRDQTKINMNRQIGVEITVEYKELEKMTKLKDYGATLKTKRRICSYDIIRENGDLKFLVRLKHDDAVEETKIISLEEINSIFSSNNIPHLC